MNRYFKLRLVLINKFQNLKCRTTLLKTYSGRTLNSFGSISSLSFLLFPHFLACTYVAWKRSHIAHLHYISSKLVWFNLFCICLSFCRGCTTGRNPFWKSIFICMSFKLTNALSFYRSQNVLCQSKFFEPAQKFYCI